MPVLRCRRHRAAHGAARRHLIKRCWHAAPTRMVTRFLSLSADWIAQRSRSASARMLCRSTWCAGPGSRQCIPVDLDGRQRLRHCLLPRAGRSVRLSTRRNTCWLFRPRHDCHCNGGALMPCGCRRVTTAITWTTAESIAGSRRSPRRWHHLQADARFGILCVTIYSQSLRRSARRGLHRDRVPERLHVRCRLLHRFGRSSHLAASRASVLSDVGRQTKGFCNESRHCM